MPAFWMPDEASSKSVPDLRRALGAEWALTDCGQWLADPWQALREAHGGSPGRDLLLLRRDLPLPDGFWPRLANAWNALEDIDVLSCLDATQVPAPEGLDSLATDAACWRYAEHAAFDCPDISLHASLWRASALARMFADAGPAAIVPQLRKAMLPCLWTEAGIMASAESPPAWLQLLADRISSANGRDGARHLGDGRPVVLHVLHAWGGGIECFARDLQAGDDERHHLFLLSQHDNFEPPFGRRLSLFADLDAPALRTWELANAIEDTATHSPEMQRLLDGIVAEWGIGAVLVSSLIGHSLDVLRTGLPTAVCVHDIYPLWPLLHDSRDPRSDAFDEATLARKLVEPGPPRLFRQSDAGHWQRLRRAYVDTLLERQVAMVTPSAFSRARICAIEPGLAELKWQEIPHGAPPMPRLETPSAAGSESRQATREPLRVLVPGHIPGGKGEWLLRELLPMLDEGFEVFLLGAGPAGHPFISLPFVRFQEHYRREHLAESVARFRPDVALLPSTVPETWGYVLTEMQQLGVPVLAGRQGAYAERLRDGAGGWLVEPHAMALSDALKELRDHRERLQQAGLAANEGFSDPRLMARAWRAALPALPFLPRLPFASGERVQLLVERSGWQRERAAQSDALARLGEQNRLLELDNLDESEQRHLLECDLSIKLAKLEQAEAEQEALQADNDMLQREAVAQLQALSAAEDELVRSRRELARVQALADETRRQLQEWPSRLAAARAEALETRHRLDAAEAEAGQVRIALQTHAENSAALEQHVSQARVELANALSRITAMAGQQALAQQQIDAMSVRQSLADGQIEAYEASAARARTHIAHLSDRNDELQRSLHVVLNQLNEVYQSRSWRITASLRATKEVGLALAYRSSRATQWLHRAVASVRSRGLLASWQRFRQRPATAITANMPAMTAVSAAGDGHRLQFAPVATPKASIIIPIYNQVPMTLDCLATIAQQGAGCKFEVIVVDDASSDESAAGLADIPGLRLHRNARNLGFIGACNAGAALARGEFVVFLNNDTLVQANWLDALLDTFASHPDTGLAGSKLVYPDGRLQEAGGIVFSDGSGWNYGRFDDPSHPAYNFVREVDYCSGAAIALRTSLFRELDGFDSHYAPAYYEDTDLAMRVRQQGLKVRYQPASVVVHLEGATSGTDLQHGVKAYQVANHGKFLARWQPVLEREHPAPGTDIANASSHRSRRRLLVIDACTPMPDRDSGSVRMFELLRLMVDEGHAVTFFADNRMHDGPYTEALQHLGVQAWWHPWLADVPGWLKEHGPHYDAIIVSRHYILAPLLPLLRQYAPQARIVFDTVDLHFLREQREAEQRNDDGARNAARRTRDAELSLVRHAHETWVVSPVEQQLLAELEPSARVAVLSNIHRPRGLGPGHGERSDLMFVGGYRHTPNVDAVLWLAKEIFPLVRLRNPHIRLHLGGSDTPDSVRDLGALPGIVVHGHVPDLTPLLDRTRINLAPLRYGAGVKGKINHSLAHGLPVVATTCAAEGMQLTHRVDAMVADSAADFAQSVLELYGDADLWQRLASAGLENTHRHFSPERARPVLANMLGY